MPMTSRSRLLWVTHVTDANTCHTQARVLLIFLLMKRKRQAVDCVRHAQTSAGMQLSILCGLRVLIGKSFVDHNGHLYVRLSQTQNISKAVHVPVYQYMVHVPANLVLVLVRICIHVCTCPDTAATICTSDTCMYEAK